MFNGRPLKLDRDFTTNTSLQTSSKSLNILVTLIKSSKFSCFQRSQA